LFQYKFLCGVSSNTATRIQLNSYSKFELNLHLCITLKADQFITRVPVYKVKQIGVTIPKPSVYQLH